MVAGLLAALLLAAMGAPGAALLRRFDAAFTPLEQVAYGLSLGIVAGSLALLVLAIAFGLSTGLVILVAALSVATAAALWPGRPRWPGLVARARSRGPAALMPPFGRSTAERVTVPAPDGSAVAVAPPGEEDALHSSHAERRLSRRRQWDEAWPVRGDSDEGTDVCGPAIGARLPAALAWGRRNAGALLVLLGFILLWAHFYANALVERDGALFATNAGHVWSDWALHLGHTAGFAFADNFPPANPDFSGHAFNYHYLSSITAAAMVHLGMNPPAALDLFGFLLMTLLTLGVFAFALRLSADVAVSALALVIFLLGGGLGWLLTAGRIAASGNPLATLLQRPWDDQAWAAANFRWETPFLHTIGPQIPFLFGLPLTMLVLSALLAGVARGERRLFVFAGAVAGLLPLAHLGALQALALITPFAFLFLVRRRSFLNWLLFFTAWVAAAVPQLYLLEGGLGHQTAAGLRLDLGWISPPDSAALFWLKNLGLFLPLLAVSLLARTSLPPRSRRILWAFMPIFLLANLFAFQPNDWDNTKVLTFWFLAASLLVAALLMAIWRRWHNVLARGLVAAAVMSLVLSGTLMHLNNVLGNDAYQLASAEDLELATAVRAETPPQALFVTDLRHNDPVTMLAGRRALMAYPGWLWPWGIDYAQRGRDLQAIYDYAPSAPQLLHRYHVDFVVFSPTAVDQLGGNVAAYEAHYPVLIQTPSYRVFDIRGGQTGS